MENNCKNQSRGYSADFIIKIKCDRDLPLCGNVQVINSDSTYSFNDFLEMVLLMQKEMDKRGIPMADTAFRRFTNEL